MTKETIIRLTLIGLLLFITVLFLKMIEQFLMAIFMAALLTAVVKPLHSRLTVLLKGRSTLATIITLLGIILLLVIPLSILATMMVGQAIVIGQSVTPWVQSFINQPSSAAHWLENLPFYHEFLPYRDVILRKAGELVGTLSTFFINTLTDFSRVTINALFSAIIMLYVMFYFLNMGNLLLEKVLYFLPLDDSSERRLLRRFTSVTRATLKGTVIIGVMQGTICGIAFAICGIEGPIFWGSLMAVSSIIPAVGTALVWFPALLVMMFTSHYLNATVLLVLCGIVAGNLDNFVRPRLVGKDTEMHELFVLFGTLGGLSMFGLPGIIIGPIVTALFITLWEIYGELFREYLPKVEIALPVKKTGPRQTPENKTPQNSRKNR
ncbi:AI-2E family transporter [Desulforhopalus vacuolatus]|uniref:AI-2E family transporter n=1 Tax=Desulforhopalus vacuolatus TaxID=40414 RepID=UPI00196566D9|nr:AI-2E family transporter [Desulforhopalus vacuolatus]MBM9521047.1 AI-2E family transporter [Desulforhopalus vacuolatus]